MQRTQYSSKQDELLSGMETTRLSRVRRHYLAAMGIIAVFAIICGVILYSAIQVPEHDIRVINMAGFQRALSQRLALLAVQAVYEPDADRPGGAVDQLRDTFSQMLNEHNALVEENLSPEIRALYFEPPLEADRLVRDYLSAAYLLADAPPEERTPQNTNFIYLRDNATPLLNVLNEVSTQFQKQTVNTLTELGQLSMLLAFSILVVLVLVGLLIFYPMEKRLIHRHNLLRENHQIIEKILRTLPDYVYIYDPQKQHEGYFNRSLVSDLEYEPDEIAAMGNPPLFAIIHPEDRPLIDVMITQLMEGTELVENEFRLKDAGDNWRWFSLRGVVFSHRTDGTPHQLLCLVRDLTLLKETEMALREDEERFQQLVENLDEVLWMSTADDFEPLYISPSYERVWGLSRTSYYQNPQSSLDVIHPDDKERYMAYRKDNLYKSDYSIEYRIIRPDNTVRWVWSRRFPIRNAEGKIYRLAGIVEDITERKQEAERLLEVLIQEYQSNQLRDFVQHISHDLKTPLAILSTGLSLVPRITDPVKLASRLETLQDQVSRLNTLLDQLLNMSRLDTLERPTLNPVDLNNLVAESEEEFHARLEKKEITFTLEPTPNLPALQLDPGQIHHAVACMLHNALIFTPQGGQIIARTGKQGDSVFIEIEDTGIGIPAEEQALVFDRYYRVDKSRSSQTGGAGLGLTIVKKIADMHQGRVELKSEIDKGSCFRLILPTNLKERLEDTD